jgi:putative nucleotidyltransferase with HDIG domain
VGDEISELEELRAQLRRREAEVAEQERQLQIYAADLRETFKLERARAQELRDSYVATVRALANAVEARDSYTGQHAERVAAYALLIAQELGTQMADDPQVEFGFLLHDIGKVAVPDAILFKPEPLSDGERALMQRHAEIGWEILRGVEWLEEARAVVRHHHERWDGGGYPDGLVGDAIPLAARIFAVADTLDALTTDRPYRPARSVLAAREIIDDAAGSQFDPEVAAAFARIADAALDAVHAEHA